MGDPQQLEAEFEVSQGYAAGPCLREERREKQGYRVLTQHGRSQPPAPHTKAVTALFFLSVR